MHCEANAALLLTEGYFTKIVLLICKYNSLSSKKYLRPVALGSHRPMLCSDVHLQGEEPDRSVGDKVGIALSLQRDLAQQNVLLLRATGARLCQPPETGKEVETKGIHPFQPIVQIRLFN
jgi:hypothetical protein